MAQQGSAEWLEERRTMIGSSDAPMILGLSSYGGPFDVYQSKIEPAYEKPRTPDELEQMEWGKRLEDAVARAWAERNGHRVRRAHRIIRHKHYPMLGASLDREVIGEPWIIEVKVKRFVGPGWGEKGTATIPHDVWVQVQHQMMVTGRAFAVVVVLFSGQQLRWYNIERDPEFIARWEQAAVEWWQAHPAQHIPPPVDGSPSARRHLDRLPAAPDEETIATPEIESLVGDYVQAVRNQEQVGAQVELLKQRIQEFMGPSAVMHGPGFKVTWRQSKPARNVGWALIAKAYRAIIEKLPKQIDGTIAQIMSDGYGTTSLDDIEGLYTGLNKPARPFILDLEDKD